MREISFCLNRGFKMTKWNLRSKRKPTGGLLKRIGKKKKHQRGRDFLPTHIGEIKKRELRIRGGGKKSLLLSANVANIMVGEKAQKSKIITVLQNPADAQFARRNIITKGAIIETELGKARVTGRPGRDGVVNAVMIEEKK
jgi:small subunit ribosomal protein S8e